MAHTPLREKRKMLVRMASGTIEEKIKRTKEGSQHRLSFLTGGVSVHNLCICYYYVFFISEMSLNHTWAIPLTLKNDLFAENTEKNLFSKYRRYSKLKVRYTWYCSRMWKHLDTRLTRFPTIEILSPGLNALLVSILLKPFRFFFDVNTFYTIFSIFDMHARSCLVWGT